MFDTLSYMDILLALTFGFQSSSKQEWPNIVYLVLTGMKQIYFIEIPRKLQQSV